MTDYGSGAPGALGGRFIDEPAKWDCARTDGTWAIGDSILRNDHPDLETRLPFPLAVDAQGGRNTEGCVDALEDHVGTYGEPARLVMAAGTNDVFDPPAIVTQLDRVAFLLPDTRIVWVDTWVRRWKRTDSIEQRLFDQQNSGLVNAFIHEAAGRFDWGIARWCQYLSSPNSSGALTRPGQCLTDGVHTSEVGRVVRNTLIAQALD